MKQRDAITRSDSKRSPSPLSLLWAALVACCLLVSAPNVHGQNWLVTVAPNRAVDWSRAGVEGGIPNRTTICATLSPGVSAAQISSATAACENGVVYLNEGTYNLTSQIRIRKSNVTLRGAGAGRTILCLTSALGGSFGGGSFIWIGDDSWQAIFSDGLPIVNLVSGANKGSMQITVSSTSNIAVGDLLFIDQVNDSSVSYVGVPTYLSRQAGTRARGQLVEVVAISGNTVTLKDPLFMSYDTALTPQAVVLRSGIITRGSGIENLTLTQPNAYTNEYRGAMITLDGAANCWVKGVEVENLSAIGIAAAGSLHVEIRDSYIHSSSIDACCGWIPLAVRGRFGNSYGYGFIFNRYNSSGLVVNNILKDVGPGLEMIGPTSGNVLAYNHSATILYNNGADNFLGIDQGSHGSYPILNLWESNSGVKINSDNTNGGAGYNTFFRGHSRGFQDDALYHGSSAALFHAGNIHLNVVGSVLGTSGKSNRYQSSDVNDLYQNPPPNNVYLIWHLGYWDSAHPTDQLVLSTLFRWGNFDYVTNRTHWDAADVPTAHGVQVPPNQLLPPSLFLSAKPSWFVTPWGAVPWPAIGPDVSGGQDPAGHANKLPAQLCYENLNLGGGGRFDPQTCYGAADTLPPAAPRNLRGQ